MPTGRQMKQGHDAQLAHEIGRIATVMEATEKRNAALHGELLAMLETMKPLMERAARDANRKPDDAEE